jgi:chloramphenicol-sensitive protein RarD
VSARAGSGDTASGDPASGGARGALASVTASVMFGAVFFVPSLLTPLTPSQVFAWRAIFTVPTLAVLLSLIGGWRDVRRVAGLLRWHPRRVLVLVVDALLLGVQVWMFAWAPRTGHALDVSLGYLLMPLVMVVAGAVLHGERFTALRIVAVVCAVIGVVAAVALGGGIAWPTLVVALGYPLYFTIRTRAELNTVGAFAGESLVLLPIAAWVVAGLPPFGPFAWPQPIALLGGALLGVIGGTALVLYLAASRLLPFGVFGLLSYLEPVLLVVVSVVLLHDPLTPADAAVYGPVALALIAVAADGFRVGGRAGGRMGDDLSVRRPSRRVRAARARIDPSE